MPLTEPEKLLVTGDNNDLLDFSDSDQCLIVDHREEEESIFDAVAALLPDGYFQHDFDGESAFSVTCGDRTEELQLELDPEDRYRALRFINHMIKPAYEMKILKCRYHDDTHSFLLRPAAWWTEFAKTYPGKLQELFLDLDETTDFH